MEFIYLLLFTVYSVVPPVALNRTLNLIYIKKDKYGWHYHYLFKYLITLSFLPLLFIKDLDLALIPKSPLSLILLITIAVLSVSLLPSAKKNKVVFIYLGGVFAAFMEEMLYRGILFGLAMLVFQNQWIALLSTSLAFGGWHLKNIPWSGRKGAVKQFFYTGLYAGPIFSILRILTGDIYLAVFVHYLMDTSVALAPNWARGWLVFGGRGKNDKDDFDKR